MARIFLALVGVAYLALAAWCAVAPQKTSRAVGFELAPGAGQSEFLTVYGGLEFALGLVFLWPLLRPQDVGYALLVCLAVHVSLVAFRTASFVLYSGVPNSTYMLAAVEWVILLGTVACYWRAT
jgi:hypothetical protein